MDLFNVSVRGRQMVRQGSAKPLSAVRFRPPPKTLTCAVASIRIGVKLEPVYEGE
jgi:hypothetical protein